MNSMKYAGKKHKPQITNDPNLQLEDKNVFKDARVRLILIKNRRHNELEKKKTIANIKSSSFRETTSGWQLDIFTSESIRP